MEDINRIIGIVGSTGFIGQNLKQWFVSEGKIVNEISLRGSFNWNSLFDNSNVIVNLVGKAHDHQGTATEEDYHHVNVTLAKKVFEAFVDSQASLLIHISSLAAIEEFEASAPLAESDKCRPVSWYGKSKREAEEWLLSQSLPLNKKLIVLRPPMVHGPGDKGNLGLLYKLISRGIPYPLSSFDNKRSFISIDNFCFCIQQVVNNIEKLNSGVYHIADDDSISTKEIIVIIKNITGKNIPNIALPKFLVRSLAMVGDIFPIPLNSKRLRKMTSNLLVSNSKIKEALGVDRLPLSAREGIEKTITSLKGGASN